MIEPEAERASAEVVRAVLDPSYQVTDPAVQVLQLAMTGFGYNFYDARNAARANDLLVREKSAEYLNAAAAKAQDLEHAYRKMFMPPPSREQPFPSPEKSARAQALHELARRLRSLASQIITMPVPQPDAVWSRIRDEAQTLQALLSHDVVMIGISTGIRDAVNALTVDACDSDSALDDVAKTLDALEQSFENRSETLRVPSKPAGGAVQQRTF